MTYNLNGKNIRIPDTEIEKSMKALDLTKEEAIEMWLEDEGYMENEEQEELEKKAKDNKITATIHQASSVDKTQKKTQKERCRKEDPTKEMVIAEIAKLLLNFAENVEILNPSKLISLKIGDEFYEIDLKFSRNKTKAYKASKK